MITVEDWAEIRRLYRSEGLSKAAIARHLGISRNTVAAALKSDRPPKYQRPPAGSVVDAYETRIRMLLAQYPTMPATVIAERIGYPHSMTVLKQRVAILRPHFVGIDPADRIEHLPGETAQCDLWFPDTRIPVGHGQGRILPVLVMTAAHSRWTSARMICSRKAGDILDATWHILNAWGRTPRSLVWDREAAIGGTGKPSTEAAAFVGTLGIRLTLAPPRDPEFKGLVERRNGYLETSFLPGRTFTSPADFNTQISTWLTERANQRTIRALQASPAQRWDTDRAAMIPLPPISPATGLTHRIRLARDYYIRLDGNDYSVDPRAIGHFVEATTAGGQVRITSDGTLVGLHERCWATAQTITDPAHQVIAKDLRRAYSTRTRQRPAVRSHDDGHVVALRALPDYDALFGVDFHTTHPDLPEGAIS